jgi:hypothetical protein
MSYEENMNAIMNLPIVKELVKKNKNLQKKNKALRNLIYSLPEFRCGCYKNCCGQNKVQPLFDQTVEFVDKVFIKKEPGVDEVREPENICIDDEIIVLEKNPNNDKPNIVYEIEETKEEVEEGEVVEEEEEVVEEETEETEEVVEEEEEEVVEEETEEVVEEEEEEVVEEETEELVEEEEEVVEETEEDAGEVYEITISGKSYYVTDEKNGKIYAIDQDEEVGDEIGEFKNGKACFYK